MSKRNPPEIWKDILCIPRSELGKFRRESRVLHVQKVRCAHGDKKGPAHEVVYYANGRISCVNHTRQEVREALRNHKTMRGFGAGISKGRSTCFDYIIAQREDYERRRVSAHKGASYVPKNVRELEWARHGTPSCVTRVLSWRASAEEANEERALLRAEGYDLDRAHPRVVAAEAISALRRWKHDQSAPRSKMGPAEFQIWSSLMEVPILHLPASKHGWAPFGMLLGAQLARSARLLHLGAFLSWREDSRGRMQVRCAGGTARGRFYTSWSIFLLDVENHCVWTPERGVRTNWQRAGVDVGCYTWIPVRWDGKIWRGGVDMNPLVQPQLTSTAFQHWVDWEIDEEERTRQEGGPIRPRPARPNLLECSELERNCWPVWNPELLKLTDPNLFRASRPRKSTKKEKTA